MTVIIIMIIIYKYDRLAIVHYLVVIKIFIVVCFSQTAIAFLLESFANT